MHRQKLPIGIQTFAKIRDHLVGIEFSKERRSVAGFAVETLAS